MEFPTIDKFAKDVAEKALDEYVYDGKTIREWVEVIAKQQSCEDAISREAIDEYITNLLSGYLYDEERTRLEDLSAFVWELQPVTPQQKIGHWILLDECSNSGYYCSECHKKVIKEGWSDTVKKIKYCPNCGAKMEVEDEDSNN